MRKAGFLRSPSPGWAKDLDGVSAEARDLANQARKLFGIRRWIWKLNLFLIGALVVTHLALKFIVPGFAAAEYLAVELGVMEAGTLIVTRRLKKKEERLKKEFLEGSSGGEPE